LPAHPLTLQHKAGFVYERHLLPGQPQLQFVTQNLTDIAWAFSDRDMWPRPLFDAIAARAEENMGDMSRSSTVDLALVFGNGAAKDPSFRYPGLYARLEQHVGAILPELGPAYMSDIMWSFAVAGHQLSDSIKKLVLDLAWLKWDRVTADRAALTRLLWSLLKLDADRVAPGHPLFAAFKELMQQPAAEDAGDAESQEESSATDSRLS
ncbi:uncharacterized protein HaLaN_15687, partial [Haematococcus lacustris]